MENEKVIEIELSKLRDEILFLKICQLDFIKYATIMFGTIITVVVSIMQFFKIDNIYAISDSNVIKIILIVSIPVIITLPYFLWIIIHKCRSVFRIVAYIRFVEENYLVRSEVCIFGYENLQSQMKKHPWLLSRISTFSFSFKKLFNDMRFYLFQTSKAIKNYRKSEQIQPTRSKIISTIGNNKRHKVSYLGDYYGRLLFFMKLLFLISIVVILFLIAYGIFINVNSSYGYIYYAIITVLLLWSIYFYNLSRKQLKEIRYRPFSIDAYYDMWNWAFIKMKQRDVCPKPTPDY